MFKPHLRIFRHGDQIKMDAKKLSQITKTCYGYLDHIKKKCQRALCSSHPREMGKLILANLNKNLTNIPFKW